MMKNTKRLLLTTSLICFVAAAVMAADQKISQLPLGAASGTNTNDSFPYVDSVGVATKRLKLSDIVNLPSMSSALGLKAPLASPTFTGTVTAPTVVGALTGNSSTATALASNPTDCSSNTFATSIDASGNLTCSSVGDGALSSAYLYANGSRGLSSDWNAGAHSIIANTFIGALTGNASGSAASFTGSLSGDVTGNQGSTAISASTVTGKLITGFSSGSGTVAATDTILQAINKLDGNIGLKAPLASPSFTGTVSSSGQLSIGASSLATPISAFRDSNAGDSTNPVSVKIGNSTTSQGALYLRYTNAAASGAPEGLIAFQPRNNANTSDIAPANISLKKDAGADTGSITLTAAATSISGTLNVTGAITGNLTGNASGSAASFTGSLSGDVTGTQGSTAISASTVTGKLITGFSSGSGTVAATDTILQAIDKLDGNDALKAPIASPTFTGTLTAPTIVSSSTTDSTTTSTGAITTSGGIGAAKTIRSPQYFGSSTSAAQGTFYGWSNAGAQASSGQIELGSSASAKGQIEYDNVSTGHMIFSNTQDNAAHGFTFKTRTSGTPVTVLTINGTGTVSVPVNMKLGGQTFLMSATAAAVTTYGCTAGSPAILANGTTSFRITQGSGTCGSTMTLNMPAAPNGWNCSGTDISNTGQRLVLSSASATAPVLTHLTALGVASNYDANEVDLITCFAY